MSSWLPLLLLLVVSLSPGTAAGEAAALTEELTLPAELRPQEAPQAPGDAPRLTGPLPALRMPAGFSTHSGGFIEFAFHPSQREQVEPLFAEAERMRKSLSERLGRPPMTGVHVHIARTPAEMETLAPLGAPYPSYASGVAYPQLGLILLTVTPLNPGGRHDLAEVFRHELAHIALHQALGGRHVPRWFNEGFAVFVSGEGSVVRLQALWTATVANSLVPLSQLERSFPADASTASVAYAQAADFVRFLVRRQERHRFTALIEAMNQGVPFSDALAQAYGASLDVLESEWREDLARRYSIWPLLLSGTVLWAGLVGLFFWGWRRRRKEARRVLDRWAKEEAEEEARRKATAAPRIHIVLASNPQPEQAYPPRPTPRDVDVPKVEHDGNWHTLH